MNFFKTQKLGFFSFVYLDWLHFHLFSQVGVVDSSLEWNPGQRGAGRQEKKKLFGSWNINSWSLILSIWLLTKRRNFLMKCERVLSTSPLSSRTVLSHWESSQTLLQPVPALGSSLLLRPGLIYSTCYSTATLTSFSCRKQQKQQLLIQKTRIYCVEMQLRI